MNHINCDTLTNKYFLKEETQESPCIVLLINNQLTKFFYENFADYEYPYFLCIYNINDINKTKEGEFITKAFICNLKNNDCNKNNQIENDKDNEMNYILEVYFQKPKKISFFVNMLQDTELDNIVMSFKCPKSGSAEQKELFSNEIIQDMLIEKEDYDLFFYEIENKSFSVSNIEKQNKKELKLNSLYEITNKLKNIIIKKKFNNEMQKLLNNKIDSIDLFDFIYRRFFAFVDLKSIKIIKITDSYYNNKRSKSLSINRNEIISQSFQCKNSILNFVESVNNNTKNNIICFKYEKNDNQENKSNKIICVCSKSFGYNMQISDLLVYQEKDQNDCYSNQTISFEVLTADNLTEIKKIILKKAETIFAFLSEISQIKNEILPKCPDFSTPNITLIFKLIKKPSEKNCFLPILTEIKTFEESLYSIKDIITNDSFINKLNSNKFFHSWHNFLLEKSYDYLLQNKKIALVGYDYSDLSFYEYCRQNKIQLYFLESKLPNDPFLDNYIKADNLINTNLYCFSSYDKETFKAAEKLKDLSINGLITFNDDLIPFKVLLQEKLNLKFNYKTTFEEIMICKDKVDTTAKLMKMPSTLPFNEYDHITDAEVIDENNIDKIFINGKKVFKMSKTCGSFGIEIIEPIYKDDLDLSDYNNQSFCCSHQNYVIDKYFNNTYNHFIGKTNFEYKEINFFNKNDNNKNYKNNCNINNKIIDQEKTRALIKKIYTQKKLYVENCPKDNGFGLFFDFKYFLSSFVEGTEHTITLIINNGKCIWYLISDVIADKSDNDQFYFEKACFFPSKVLLNFSENEKIKNIILGKILELNLTHCCVNVDFKKNEHGIKIFDINPRTANWYYKDWAQKITGVSIYKAELCLNLPIKYHCVSMPKDSIIKGIPVFSEEELTKFNCDFVFKNANYKNGLEEKDLYAEACWIERIFV